MDQEQIVQSVDRWFERFNSGDFDLRVVLLVGEMGAGKTFMVKRIAHNLGIEAVVNSPTYTYLKEYPLGSQSKFIHVDLWRVDPGEAEGLGIDKYLSQKGNFIAIEWPKGEFELDNLKEKIRRLGIKGRVEQLKIFQADGTDLRKIDFK